MVQKKSFFECCYFRQGAIVPNSVWFMFIKSLRVNYDRIYFQGDLIAVVSKFDFFFLRSISYSMLKGKAHFFLVHLGNLFLLFN